jgi:hypothetical protein
VLAPVGPQATSRPMCNGLHLLTAGLAIIGDLGSRFVRLSGRVWLTLGDPGLTISVTDSHFIGAGSRSDWGEAMRLIGPAVVCAVDFTTFARAGTPVDCARRL